VGIPTVAVGAVGIWQWQVKSWIDDYTEIMKNRADDRKEFIKGELEKLKTQANTVAKAIGELGVEGNPNLQLWDDLSAVNEQMNSIDGVRVSETRIQRNLRSLRDWGTGLIVGCAVVLAIYAAEVAYGLDPLSSLFIVMIAAYAAVLVPVVRVNRRYRRFVELRNSLRQKGLLD